MADIRFDALSENESMVDALDAIELAMEPARSLGKFMVAIWFPMGPADLRMHLVSWQFPPEMNGQAIAHLKGHLEKQLKETLQPALPDQLPVAKLPAGLAGMIKASVETTSSPIVENPIPMMEDVVISDPPPMSGQERYKTPEMIQELKDDEGGNGQCNKDQDS